MKSIILSLAFALGAMFTAQAQITIENYERELKVNVDDTDQLQAPKASSSCGELQVTRKEAIFSGGCLGNLVLTFTYTDECGNSATAEQYCLLLDTVDPVFNEKPEDLQVANESEIPDAPKVTASDNSDGKVKVVMEEQREKKALIRTWTASDQCGNIVKHTQRITFKAS
jgi:hypothetical protein